VVQSQKPKTAVGYSQYHLR